MKKYLSFVVAAAALALAPVASHAALQLTLAPADGNYTVPVGQPVTVNAVLSGVEPGQSFDTLSATAVIDTTMFSAGTPVPGAILPVVPDTFFPAVTPVASPANTAEVSVVFSNIGGTAENGGAVTGNGVFFSFTLTPAVAGTSTIMLAEPLLFFPAGSNDAVEVLAGAPLQFTAAVPEPALATMALAALAIPVVARRRRIA